jgi:hypothetical protein
MIASCSVLTIYCSMKSQGTEEAHDYRRQPNQDSNHLKVRAEENVFKVPEPRESRE